MRMNRLARSVMAIVAPAAMIVAMVGGAFGAPAAHAYGKDHVYQLTFSLNCDNKNSPLCAPDGFGLGGAWGWAEPDADGMADATVTFCGHGQGGGGAFHENLDVSWSIIPASELGSQFVVGTDPTGQYIVFDANSDLN